MPVKSPADLTAHEMASWRRMTPVQLNVEVEKRLHREDVEIQLEEALKSFNKGHLYTAMAELRGAIEIMKALAAKSEDKDDPLTIPPDTACIFKDKG